MYIYNAIYSYRQCDSTQIVFVAQVISLDIEELGLLFVVESTLPEGYERGQIIFGLFDHSSLGLWKYFLSINILAPNSDSIIMEWSPGIWMFQNQFRQYWCRWPSLLGNSVRILFFLIWLVASFGTYSKLPLCHLKEKKKERKKMGKRCIWQNSNYNGSTIIWKELKQKF